jgi:hypothetical protein
MLVLLDTSPNPFLDLGPDDLVRVESHCDDGKALLIDEFRNRPRIEAMLCALLEEVQVLDDTVWRVLTERTIDNAVGVQLDTIGDIVGQPRGSLVDDEDFRAAIRGRIKANSSDGSTEDIYAIVVATLGSPTTVIAKLRRYGTAAYTLQLKVPVGFDEGVVNTLVQDGTSGGVRAVVVVPMVDLAGTFRFGPTSALRTLAAATGFDSIATPGTGTGSLSRAMDEET